jgi:SAM-dependent methyltransferase
MADLPQTNPSAAPAAPGPLEAESDDWDGDSAFGADDLVSSTASISSSILKYRQENGRTYHGYKVCFLLLSQLSRTPIQLSKDGKYAYPNDEEENDRLDLQHHLFALTLKGKLFSASIPEEQTLHRVLDVGTGTGIWAIDFADEHPETQVFGVDLSPIQPVSVPPNVLFEIDDLEESWTFSKPFDFIFARMTVQFFGNPSHYFEQAFEHLSPGGWIECIDVVNPAKSDDNPNFKETHLWKWFVRFS